MIFFVRHSETEKDPNKNAVEWVLSTIGEEQAVELSNNLILQKANVIYSSNEVKSYLTIKPLADKLGLEIKQVEELGEVKRGDKFLTKEEFEIEKFKQLEDLDYPAFGGETGNQALTRFESAIQKIEKENPDKNIIIVSHGTILNIYFAKLLDRFSAIKNRWKATEFGAIGIVENNFLIRDIVTNTKFKNIERVLNQNDLVISYCSNSGFCLSFLTDEIEGAYKQFENLRENAITDEDYEKAWKLIHKCEMKYYPKLLPIVEILDKFYEDRKSEYRNQIFLDSRFLNDLRLEPSRDIKRYFIKDENFLKDIENELQDFDNFLKNN